MSQPSAGFIGAARVSWEPIGYDVPISRDVRKDEERDKCNRFDAGSRRS